MRQSRFLAAFLAFAMLSGAHAIESKTVDQENCEKHLASAEDFLNSDLKVTLKTDPLTLDFAHKKVTWKGQSISNTSIEFDLLATLVANFNRNISSNDLKTRDHTNALFRLKVLRKRFESVDPDFSQLRVERYVARWQTEITDKAALNEHQFRLDALHSAVEWNGESFPIGEQKLHAMKILVDHNLKVSLREVARILWPQLFPQSEKIAITRANSLWGPIRAALQQADPNFDGLHVINGVVYFF